MSHVHDAIAALRADLVHPDGPRISTMRNYRFAIVPYPPDQEFVLRGEVHRLTQDLRANGWVVQTISLHALLVERMRAQGDDWIRRVSEMERRLGRVRGQAWLQSKLSPLLEGPEGIAADVSRTITQFADAHPDKAERTLALVGRAGALYPFFRSSALLRHLDGRTKNVPVVLLYPGSRKGPTGLSFMDQLPPDNDYRPRIYP